MTAFTPEDVAEITSGGNVVSNAKYLARATGRDFSIPTGDFESVCNAPYTDVNFFLVVRN